MSVHIKFLSFCRNIGRGGTMKKSFLLKLCVIAMVLSMVLSIAACNNNTKPEITTEEPKQETTDGRPVGDTTETPDDDTTEAPATTAPADNDTTEADTAPATTESDEPATTEAPADPVLPEADSALAIDKAVEIGLAMGHNTYTPAKYYVSGFVKEIYNEVYGNMILVDENGNEITVYGTWSEDGSERYDALGIKPVVGDLITVYGVVGQYNGTAQIKNGWMLGFGGECGMPDETDETETTETTEPATTETTEAPAPETTEAVVPETTEADVPETTEAPVPETTEADVPETTEAPAPETTAAPQEPETTEAETECDHVFVSDVAGQSHKCACGETEACLANVIEGDETGHWTVGCELCEIAKATATAHTTPKLSTDTDGKTYTYTYKCIDCGHVLETRTVEIGADGNGINYYVTAWNSIGLNAWNTGGKGAAGDAVGELMYDADEGIVFSRVTLQDGGSFELVSTTDNTVTKGFNGPEGILYGGTGSYLVLKVRIGSGEEELRLLLNSKDATPDWVFNEMRRSDTNTEWAVFVIDTSAFLQTYYEKASDAGKITIGMKGDSSGGNAEAPEADDYVDIAYVALCDNWVEVDAVVGNDSIVITNWKESAGDAVKTPEELDKIVEDSLVCHHASVEYVKSGNTVSCKCMLCGEVASTFNIGADGINWFTAPGKNFGNRWNAGGLGGNKTIFGTVSTDSVNNVKFTNVAFAEGGSAEILNGTASFNGNASAAYQTLYGTGNFFVLKLRATPGTAVSFVAIDGLQGNKTIADWMFGTHTKTITADGWVTYVINLDGYDHAGAYVKDNADATKGMFYLRINGGSLDLA